MATIGVELRNEANTSTTLTVDGAFNVEFQKARNADPGSGAFLLRKGDPDNASLTFRSLVRFLVTPDDAPSAAVAFPARVIDIDPVVVTVGEESVEAVQYTCAGLLVDWDKGAVTPSLLQCDLVPSMDERVWHWSSGEYSAEAASWDTADPVAGQGWGSLFYTGQPAGWTDSAAFFLWHNDGLIPPDPLDVNALPGRCLFYQTFLVGAGRKYLEWAADNWGALYVNGRRMQEGGDFRKKQTLEFETTAGFLTLAWDVVNAEDDGPVGGNPAALIASLREGDPATGDIIWRTYAGPTQMRCLPYPSSYPQFSAGTILRLARENNPITDLWTVAGSDLVDANGASWAPDGMIDNLAFRLYDDTLLDVQRTLCQTWTDVKVDPVGKVLHPYLKGTAATPAPVTLVVGYSAAGEANPDTVNVLDLKWNYTEPLFTKLALRWADGWVVRGTGDLLGSYRAEQINDVATANTVADQLLSLYGQVRRTASFTYLALDETTDLPLDAFDVGDTIDVPYGPTGDDYWEDRVVQSVTYTGDGDGRVTSIVIEAGDPITDTLEAFEEQIRRGAPGQLGGRAAGASPTTGKAAYGQFDRYSVSTPTAGSTTHCIASMPSPTSGLSSTAPCLFVGAVVSLRLIGEGSTGTSTVTVSDGTTTWTLTGSANGQVDFELVGAVWTTRTILTVTVVTANHTALHVYADVGDVR